MAECERHRSTSEGEEEESSAFAINIGSEPDFRTISFITRKITIFSLDSTTTTTTTSKRH
jgi:hypothetical protein